LFALSFLTLVVFIILFTVAFGRLFCGWACPQTIFMEMVFRKIEYWIEGDAPKQRRLNKGPWTFEKVWKKSLKYVIFYAISFFIGNTFLAYIIGTDELFKIITAPPSEHLSGFIAMVAFTSVFFMVFSWFREQACLMVCPYGRLQGVLLDKDSVVISYDFNRGEPRGKLKKSAKTQDAQELVMEQVSDQGDCIDCGLCVQVCPTGIDIRNGTQLECVNCTACIDACDSIMDKVGKPKGLIRYSSFNAISEGKGFHLTPRIIGYSVVLVILLSVVTFLMMSRVSIETTILRTPGMLYQETPDGRLQNLYNIQVVNKTSDTQHITLRLKGTGEQIPMVSGTELLVKPEGLGESALFVKLSPEQLTGKVTPIEIEVYHQDKLLEVVKTNF
ncbi:MAG TPA: cytochrome c oxidase accessory protein CcoG, partial [Calditrichia bacterium]|nr:cytochrome c oxidase accessory protein CcoG [Calditrichia bacterium]